MKRILIASAAMVAVMMLTGCSTTVTGIDVPESMTVEVGQPVDLAVNYTYKNENASDEKKAAAQSEAGVKLTSDSPAVTVAEDGTLTAAQGGEAIITVTSADGTLSDTCKVTVTVPLTGIALDQETLDTAMKALAMLHQGGRTIGIISHVSELRSRIGNRIEVSRLRDGSADAKVVAAE